VSHSTYQQHKSDHDKDAMVSGAGITTAMEVEDSSDSDSEAGDTGDFSDLGLVMNLEWKLMTYPGIILRILGLWGWYDGI